MAMAHDAASSPTQGTGTLTWVHTPVVGTPSGLDFQVGTTLSSADGVTGITYGGVPCSRYAFAVNAAGQLSTAHGYNLLTGIPSGAQTVIVSVTGTFLRCASVKSMTAAGAVVLDSSNTGNGAGVSNPTLTVTTTAATDTLVYAGFAITENQASVSVTSPDLLLNKSGNTNETQLFARNSVNGTGGPVGIGATFNNDSWAGVIGAYAESAAAPDPVPPPLVMAPMA